MIGESFDDRWSDAGSNHKHNKRDARFSTRKRGSVTAPTIVKNTTTQMATT